MPFRKGDVAWNKLDPKEKKRRANERQRRLYVRQRKTNPEFVHRMRENGRRRFQANKRQYRGYALKSIYGISLTKYDEMVCAQEGRCLICKRTAQLHIDHNHMNGKVRGLLCAACNHGLGMFGDDPRLLMDAANYLGGGSSGTR